MLYRTHRVEMLEFRTAGHRHRLDHQSCDGHIHTEYDTDGRRWLLFADICNSISSILCDAVSHAYTANLASRCTRCWRCDTWQCQRTCCLITAAQCDVSMCVQMQQLFASLLYHGAMGHESRAPAAEKQTNLSYLHRSPFPLFILSVSIATLSHNIHVYHHILHVYPKTHICNAHT